MCEYVYVWHMHACVQKCVGRLAHACAWEGQRSAVSSSVTFHFIFFRKSLSLHLERSVLARLVGHQVPGIYLSFSSSSTGLANGMITPGFYMGAGI